MANKASAAAILNSRTAATAKKIQEQETAPAEKGKVGRPKEHKEEYKRLCFALPESVRNEIDAAILYYSRPGAMLTVTDLIIKLVNEDKERRERTKK